MMDVAEERTRFIDRYRQLRAVSRKLHNELIHHVSSQVFKECSEKLGFLADRTLVFENEAESHVLMDYCIYDGWSGEHNAVTQFLAQRPYPPDSDEMMLLQAMAKARYSLFQVQSVAPGLGVNCLDILRGDGGSIIDEGLGNTAVPGVVFAGRLITFAEFSMTTGAALPVDTDTLVAIWNVLEGGPFDVGRVDYLHLSRQEQAVMSSKIIRCALSRGASSHITHEEPVRGCSPLKHVSRNDPCPCGSGKKYKKCCGG